MEDDWVFLILAGETHRCTSTQHDGQASQPHPLSAESDSGVRGR